MHSEYLATFKKTVAMHEVFLSRLASHPVFRNDHHLKVFLEYDQDLCARPRKKLDLFGGLVRNFGKTTDEIYLGATIRDVNDFFENELQFLTEYNSHLKEAAGRTERMTKKHKEVADSHIKISSSLMQLSTIEHGSMEKFLAKTSEVFEKIRVGLSLVSLVLQLLIQSHFVEHGGQSLKRSGPETGRHITILSTRFACSQSTVGAPTTLFIGI